MVGYRTSRRLRALTLGLCIVSIVLPPRALQAGGGLAAIDAFHVGRYHLANGDRAKALDSFNDSLRMNPQFVQAYIARGKLLAEMGQLDSALADLNFALRLQPTHPEGFAYRGFVLLSQGKAQESLPEFDMALRLDPSYARVHYLRGQALRTLGNEAEGQTAIASALRLDPSIEALKVVVTAASDDGAVGVQINGAGALERHTLMADTTVPQPTARSPRDQGRVIRVDQHPLLANLTAPANLSAPPPQTMPAVIAPPAGQPIRSPEATNPEINTVRKPGPHKVSTLPPGSVEDLNAAPVPEAGPKRVEAVDKLDPTAPSSLAGRLEPLPTIEPLPPVEPLPVTMDAPPSESKPAGEPPLVVALPLNDVPTAAPVPPLPEPLPEATSPEAGPAPTAVVETPAMPPLPIIEALPPVDAEPIGPLPLSAPPAVAAQAPIGVLPSAAPQPLEQLPEVAPPSEPLPMIDGVPVVESVPAVEPIAATPPPPALPPLEQAPAQDLPPMQLPAVETPVAAAPAVVEQPPMIEQPPTIAQPTVAAPPEPAPLAAAPMEPVPAVEPALPVASALPVESAPSVAPNLIPSPGEAPRVAVQQLPTASEILSGSRPADAQPPKPTLEASRQRISDAIAAVQRTVASLPPAVIHDSGVAASAGAEPAVVESRPTAVPASTLLGSAEQKVVRATPQAEIDVPVAGDPQQLLADAEACRLRGVECEEQGDDAAALAEYDNALRLDPTNPQTYCLRGRLYLKSNLTLQAAADFERAVQLAPGLAIGYYGRAHARYLQHDFAAAIDDYTVTLRLDDHHAQALIERGHCLAQLGQAEAAEADRLAAVALDPELAKTGPKYGGAVPRAPVVANVGMPEETPPAIISDAPSRLQQTSVDTAYGDLFRAQPAGGQPAATAFASDSGVTPIPAAAPTVQATVSDAAAPNVAPAEPADVLPSQLDGAALRHDVEQLTAELSRTPGDARLYLSRGEKLLQLGRAEDAIDDLNAALRIDPTLTQALRLRAEAHAAVSRMPAADADLSELLRLQPHDAKLLAERGRVRLTLGMTQEALADLNAALAVDAGNAEAYCHRALAFALLGDLQRALADFAAAAERNPNEADIYLCRGRALVEFGHTAEALADFNHAVQLNPQSADAYFERSRVYAARGAYAKSQADRARALELDPTLR